MDRKTLKEIVREHKLWIDTDGKEGIRANFCGKDLRDVDFQSIYLPHANFYDTDLDGADFNYANLQYANFCGANLDHVDFSNADLRHASFCLASFQKADLSHANLSHADLTDTYLCGANFSDADLSMTKFPKTRDFIQTLEKDELGFIVYKGFGKTSYPPNPNWKIEEGSFIEETVNPNRQDCCGCGVNVASTIAWVKANYAESTIWKCRIRFEDGPGIVVPYNGERKFRCERLELLEEIK